MEVPIHSLMYETDLNRVGEEQHDGFHPAPAHRKDSAKGNSTPTEHLNGSVPTHIGSYPRSAINVLVVGAGFGGLTATLECARKGHNVRILERNPGKDMAGRLHNE
jgi:NADPH-dependent 2,4-dienoyl-CoA reductase/sulfur reductase-like enzyme